MPKITMIPATVNPLTKLPSKGVQKRRVAGYARVSTDSDEQFTSYEAQVDYYTNYIKSKPDWEFVKVYTDEGISGLNTKRREGFNAMIQDALDGKIDLIVTKSVSRFARNTVDSLTTIRKLKEVGCECFFEKEGIYTFDGKGELLITIMSSLAQEESRSISENITWGQRKSFADGKIHLAYSRFLGYGRGEDGNPVIIEEEAKVVRLIYRMFLEGKTPAAIGKHLEKLGCLTPCGNTTWHKNTITSILTNEKYKGDALLQKRFTIDFLEKKMKPNEGEVPQYYVEGSHEAIIDPDEWDYVQFEIARRRAMGKCYSGKSVFTSKLVCEDCGGCYGPKLWHSNDKYRKAVWRCNNKYEGEYTCHTPRVEIETVKEMFLTAYDRLLHDRKRVISDCELVRKSLMDFAALDEQIQRQTEETEVVAELVRAAIQENASTSLSQEAYKQKYDSLSERYGAATQQLAQLKEERTRRQQQDQAISRFIRTLKKQPEILDTWDDTIWTLMVEKGVVHRDGSITFVFYNGTEITVGA